MSTSNEFNQQLHGHEVKTRLLIIPRIVRRKEIDQLVLKNMSLGKFNAERMVIYSVSAAVYMPKQRGILIATIRPPQLNLYPLDGGNALLLRSNINVIEMDLDENKQILFCILKRKKVIARIDLHTTHVKILNVELLKRQLLLEIVADTSSELCYVTDRVKMIWSLTYEGKNVKTIKTVVARIAGLLFNSLDKSLYYAQGRHIYKMWENRTTLHRTVSNKVHVLQHYNNVIFAVTASDKTLYIVYADDKVESRKVDSGMYGANMILIP